MAAAAHTVVGVTYDGAGGVATVRVPAPDLVAGDGDGDALVRVIVAGICGSDLHQLHGLEAVDAGTVAGHEGVGVVVAVGAGVAGVRVGDRVMTPFTTACGGCEACAAGLSARCSRARLLGARAAGAGLHGTQAELVRVPDADGTLVPLPPGLHPEEGLLVGDILSTAVFCALNAGVAGAGGGGTAGGGPRGAVAALARLVRGGGDGAVDAAAPPPPPSRRRVFVVVGCGPVGLLTLLAAAELESLAAGRHGAAGAGGRDAPPPPSPPPLFLAVDTVPARLAAAARAGATALDLAALGAAGVLAAVSAASADGRGADAVMECVGGAPPLAALRLAFDALRPGGTLAAVGVPAPGAPMPFTPAEAYDKNLTYAVGRCPARSLMPLVTELLLRARARRDAVLSPLQGVPPMPWTLADARRAVVSHRLTLADGPAAYALFAARAGGCTKAVLYATAAERDAWA